MKRINNSQNSLSSVNELDYISVENLEILYSNIQAFFIDVHKIDILNYNSNIKHILFENMKLIYGTKFASSLKTKELNVITLKNIKEILEQEIKKSNQSNQSNQISHNQNIQSNKISPNQMNVDIISRENNVYNRSNKDNKIFPSSINNTSNVIGQSNPKDVNNFINNYDNMLSERNNDMPKKSTNILNFDSEKVKSVSSKEFKNSVDDLLAKRGSIYDEVNYNSSDKPNLDENTNTISNTNENELDGFSFDEIEEHLNNLSLSPLQEQPLQEQPLQEQPLQEQPLQEQVTHLSQRLKKQIIVISSSNRDLKEYPNPNDYIIHLKIPIENVYSIKLLNVLVNVESTLNKSSRSAKSNINYLVLDFNELNLITSNNENINNKFALLYDGKKYTEEIIFTTPLDKLDKFDITIRDKNNKIPKIPKLTRSKKKSSKDTESKEVDIELSKNKKENINNENIFEFLIEYL